MDRRFFLALFLTALVIVATQLLFPVPKQARKTPRADSTQVSGTATTGPATRATSSSATASPSSASVAGTAAATAPTVSAAGAGPSATGKLATATAAETTQVLTPKVAYQFSNVGATPVSVMMRDYFAVSRAGKTSEHVDLVRRGETLLRYRLIIGRDTIRLDRTLFQLRQLPAAGAPSASTGSALTYTTTAGATTVAITYSFGADGYLTRVTGTVDGTPAPAYLLVDLPAGLRSQEADTLEDQHHLAFALKPTSGNARRVDFGKLDPGEQRLETGPLTWAAAKSKYFLVGLLTPQGGAPFAEMHLIGGPRTSKVPSTAVGTVVAPVRNGGFAFELYAGPQEWRRLHTMGRDFENANPYGGWLQGMVQPFATIVMRALLWMHDTLKLSYGWVLVIFGVIVRLALWPLNQSAMRTSLKMQRIQPEMQEVQKKHQNDPQKQHAEMMRIYKEHGMSPFSAFAGCLPMLLPMPVLFALFFVFQNTIEFRGVPFLWLHDISLKDPYYILPLVMGLSMYLLSWIGMRNAPPNPQAKMMGYVFPVMMTFFLSNLASGLNLYYAVQNLAALPQQWLIANERAREQAKAPDPTRRGRLEGKTARA